MKKWVEKLIEQFDFEWSEEAVKNGGGANPLAGMSEDRATLLFLIDTFNKHLIEIEGHPVRKTREMLDEFAKELISPREPGTTEKTLFRFRQFLSAYRIDETAYFQKTFEDFRTIIWDFVDQLAEDIGQDQKEDFEVRQSLENLKEAVESNSIDVLKHNSRKFIDCYVEKQFKKDKRKSTRMKSVRKNLNKVKKQLDEAKTAATTDHLTGSANRKAFEEYCGQQIKLSLASQQPLSILLVDIDHFKKINDTFGHDVGDFVLKELVGTLKSVFNREPDLVSRIGGEEFVIVMPETNAALAVKKAEDLMTKVRAETYVHEHHKIRFTVSIGVAQLMDGEDLSAWLKRADLALYNSKNQGRNRATLAPAALKAAS